MRTTTRHQLKQDKFAETVVEQYSWVVEHRNTLIYTGVAVAVILALVLGGWAFLEHRDQKASAALGAALAVYDAPIIPATEATQPGIVSYPTVADRARAARTQFEKVASDYSHTKSADVATYFVGVTAKDMNDLSTAENSLKKVADSSDGDLASMAKLALAGLYRETNKDQQAIEVYKQLIDHPTRSVSKSAAQLELASYYQTKNQPQEAQKLYQQIQKDDPKGIAAEIAAQQSAPKQ